MNISISNDVKMLLGLVELLKGKYTQNEIAEHCKILSGSKTRAYAFMAEMEEMGILRRDGFKTTKFGTYPAYRIDDEKLAEVVETNPDLKEIHDKLNKVERIIW